MPEDRDQLFERALARHLRAESTGDSLCLDPETLAAYHERMLRPEELSSAKSHIVSCARCQEVLAQLEATEEVNRLEGVREELLAPAAQALPGQAREKPQESADRQALEPVVLSRPKKTFPLRWVAPAGAVAAALLVWVVVRNAPVLNKRDSEAATEVAENRTQPPSSPPRDGKNEFALSEEKLGKELGLAKDREKQQSAGGSADRLTARSAPGEAASEAPLFDALEGKLERSKKKPSPAYEQNGVSGARGPSAAAAQAQANSAVQRGDVVVSGGAASLETAPAPADLDKRQLPPPASKSDALVAVQPGAPPPAPARSLSQSAADSRDSSLGAKTAEVTSTGAYRLPAFNAAVKVSLDIRITAPGGKKIWNVGPGGQIAHSVDGGKTWLLQISGVAADLIGGEAPSDQVCWIAGAAGTLLRTTDGGLHWQQLRTPVSGDLGGVHASDAKHASIWDRASHLSFATTDGGKTWNPSANQ